MRTRPQPLNLREERDFSQKLNATFGFIKQNFKPLFTCILYIVAPFALLAGIFSGLFQSSQLELINGGGLAGALGHFQGMVSSLNYMISVFFSLLSFVMLSLVVYAYIVLYMDYEGPITVGDVWEVVKNHLVPVFYSSLGVLLLCALATLLLVLPGIYVYVVLSIFIIVMVREDLGFVETVERCFFLMKGNWWPAFGFYIVVGIVQALIGFVATFPSLTVYLLRILHLPGGTNDMVFIAAGTFATIVNLLLYVISVVAIAMQYFTLVEIREGIGYLEKVNLIGQRQPLYPALEQDEA